MTMNALHASVVCTVLSFLGWQWWTATLLSRIKADGLIDGGRIHSGNAGHVLELLLGSHATVALLVNFVLNVFVLAILSLKTIFFSQLYPSETRKMMERAVNYVLYKGIFLPLIVPPNVFQVAMWSAWIIVLCTLKMFQTLARDRLERLNASPSATPRAYFRVFSVLFMVLSMDLIWMRFCTVIYKALDSSMFLLLFFEPLSIAFETSQALMVHGFQLLEMWHRNSVDSSMECLGTQSSKSAAGSFYEWKGILTRNFSFLLDMLTLLTALGHYLIIWWLRGMAFHIVDAVLFLNLRALVSGIIKRIRGYIKLRKALLSLDGALPDATMEELRTYNDECAICREPMARAKRLSCNHLFHLSCLKSWLDQGLSEVYSCPTCRRPLFLSRSRDRTRSHSSGITNDVHRVAQVNSALDEQRISAPTMTSTQRLNPPDRAWRESGVESNWTPHQPSPAADDAGTSAVRSIGLGRVQMMMRHLASVGETYAHGALEDTSWNLWPGPSHTGPSVPPPSLRNRRGSVGLRFRNTSTSPSINENMSEILAMADRVREILPHIPDELIIQDLRRTNNVMVTVNNFLPT
uniref:E3 ubiquitin protein ligase RIN2 n=1 Tax=Anthurium amnicola TaxID=1678845 RepID=A0A1D1ZJK5_9ARAE